MHTQELLILRNKIRESGYLSSFEEGVRLQRTIRLARSYAAELLEPGASAKSDWSDTLFKLQREASLGRNGELSIPEFSGDRMAFAELFLLFQRINFQKYIEMALQDQANRFIANFPKEMLDTLLPIEKLKQGISVFIPDAEKILLTNDLPKRFPHSRFYASSSQPIMKEVIKELYPDQVNLVDFDLKEGKDNIPDGVNLILATPPLGGRMVNKPHISNITKSRLENVYTEVLANRMMDDATLMIILSEGVLFSGGESLNLRQWLVSKGLIREIAGLVQGCLLPYAGVKVNCLTIKKSSTKAKDVRIVKYQTERAITRRTGFEDNPITIKVEAYMSLEQLGECETWTTDILIGDAQDGTFNYLKSNQVKMSIADVSSLVFRGKPITKNEYVENDADYFLISYGDLQRGKVNEENLRGIRVDDQAMIDKFRVFAGDVLITCRGSEIKVAYIEQIEKTIIVSDSIIVIRPNSQYSGILLKTFLSSPVGQILLESNQRGVVAKMLTPKDVKNIQVPDFSSDTMKLLENRVVEATQEHEYTIRAANDKFTLQMSEIYREMGL